MKTHAFLVKTYRITHLVLLNVDFHQSVHAFMKNDNIKAKFTFRVNFLFVSIHLCLCVCVYALLQFCGKLPGH